MEMKIEEAIKLREPLSEEGKELQAKTFESYSEVRRFVVDSIIGESIRILFADLAEDAKRKPGLIGLVPYGVWGKENEKVDSLKDVARAIGIETTDLDEGMVFVQFEEGLYDITEPVRKISKDVYSYLVKREGQPSGPQLREGK